MRSTIAIIEPVYLVATGLKQCLEQMLPPVDVLIYPTVELCRDDIERTDGTRPYFVHFFVDEDLLATNADYFRQLPQTTISLTGKLVPNATLKNFPSINIRADEQQIWLQLLNLHNSEAHRPNEILSKREIDVLRCVAKGMLNKEIADTLCISMNTVITHRQHITEKTHIRSVAALTMYAVMNGFVTSADIYQS